MFILDIWKSCLPSSLVNLGMIESGQVGWVGRRMLRAEVVLWGGNANNGAYAGLVYPNSNNAWSNSNSNIGSRHTMKYYSILSLDLAS